MFLLAVACVLAASSSARADIVSRDEIPPKVRALYQDYPVIELVTMGVGGLMWERHGHIALCVRYREPRRDACYNYGTASFGEPLSMVWGFFRGTDSFWVSKSPPGRMLAIYQRADRSIYAQPLPLTPEQKRQIIAKLEDDIQPENRYYSYDHFIDNCTTRIRDIIDDATDGAVSSMNGEVGDETIRDLAREGFYGMRIPLLITDIAMGRTTDHVPTYYERLFLPEYMREAVEEHWGIEPIVLYQRKGPPELDDGPSGRVLLALVILVLTAPAWVTRLWGRFQRAGVAVAIAPPVLLGLILWFLAIISPLPYVKANESCLIFFPLDVLLVVLSGARRQLYARIRVAMLALVALLMLVGVLQQPLLAPLLWPLIPAAVVGFWPRRDS